MASCVGFLLHDTRLLMLLRDDNPQTVYPDVWGLIGGGIEHGETPLEAMCRECREEIGVSPGLFTYIGEDAGGRHLFYASLSEQEVVRIHLGGEGQKLAFYRPHEFGGLATTPKFKEWIDFQLPVLRHLCENPNLRAERLRDLLIDNKQAA